jgi:hypothetical protein
VVQRIPDVPAPEAPTTIAVKVVEIGFTGEDLALLERLADLARKDRRTVANEILCILEDYLDAVESEA